MGKINLLSDAAALRARAEALSREREQVRAGRPHGSDELEASEILHELRVHQIELELQNEELRHSQVELAASRARYFDLYDLAPVGYLTITSKGLIEEANLESSALLSVPRAELINQRLSAFIHPEDQDAYYRARQRLFRDGGSGPALHPGIRTPSIELRLVRRGGEAFWAMLEMAAVRIDDGPLVAHLVLRDISDRRRSEEDSQRFAAILETRVEECSREILASHVSLQKTTEQLRELAERLTQAEDFERKRLAAILHDDLQQLLVSAKLHVNISSPREEIVDLLDKAVAFSQSVVEDLSPPVLWDEGLLMGLDWLVRWMKKNYDLKVHVEGPEDLETPETFSILIFQAVRELLFNVVKHAHVDEASVSVALVRGRTVRVVVSDRGRGFSNESHDGFGLLRLKERLSYAGGALTVDSAPGKGARVTLEAPIPQTTNASTPERLESSDDAEVDVGADQPAHPGVSRVMIVDDHIALRQTLVALLGTAPDIAIVGVAADGEEAVREIRARLPDVVLMDVSMPVMNGIEATRIVSREMPNVKIIGLSMHGRSEVGRAMEDAGAIAFLTKPDSVNEILATIREVQSQERKA